MPTRTTIPLLSMTSQATSPLLRKGTSPPDMVDYSRILKRGSPTWSNPSVEDTQRDAPTEVAVEAKAEASSQATGTEQPTDLEISTYRSTSRATQARKGRAKVLDSDEEPLANKRDRLVDDKIAG